MNDEFDKRNRFQYQPWYIKVWRYRHYLRIPYVAIKFYIRSKSYSRYSFRNCWATAKGLAQADMIWLYDSEEVFERMKKYMKEEQRCLEHKKI